MLEELYSVYLPKKAHPWCYISLDINPQNIDVNVHPTKHEVRFLHEDAIIERIKFALDERLTGNSASRTFYLQARLPKADITKEVLEEVLPEYDKGNSNKTKKIYQKELVRTDSSDQKLDRFNFTIHSDFQHAKESINTSEELSQNVESESFNPLEVALEKDVSTVTTENPPADDTCQEKDSNLNVNSIEDSSSLQETPVPDGSIHWSDMVDTKTSTSSNLQDTCNPTIPTVQNDESGNVGQEFNTFNISEFLQDLDDTADSPIADDSLTDTVAERALKQVYQYFGNKEIIDRKANEKEREKRIILQDINDNKKEGESSVSNANQSDNVLSTESNISADSPKSAKQFKSYSINTFKHEIKLTSILQLRKEVEDECHEGLRNILANLTFVGCIDQNSALIQSGVNLYICNTRKLA